MVARLRCCASPGLQGNFSMSPRFHTNSKPMDHHTNIEPMSYEDELFWHLRSGAPEARTERRLFVLVLGGMAIVLAGLWLAHGVLA